jgi:predicted O-methyltransferase YrrM
MTDFNYKLKNYLFPLIKDIKNLVILELGVQKGRSTKEFLKICKKNNGRLYSIDIDDCSRISEEENWKFYQTRDDNFEFIKSKIPKKIDVLFIDTLHEADHVEKIIYGYYNLVKTNGYIFIDDISHLPYTKNSERNNFYCEINNIETFKRILQIYSNNSKNIDLSFSFISSGLAVIKKKNENELNEKLNFSSRENSLKNFLRNLRNKLL